MIFGTLENLTLTGLIWYYFNILGIAATIFFVMMISYNRSKRVVINMGEGTPKDSKFPVFIKQIAIFSILFFAVREWGDDLWDVTEPVRDYIGDKFDS